MKYEVVASPAEVKRFVDWLPAEKEDEVYYVCLLSRGKYATIPSRGVNSKSDEAVLSRFLTSKDDLLEKLLKLEIDEGLYRRRGCEVHQETLVTYITVNPRNMKKGSIDLVRTLVDAVVEKRHLNPVEAALSAVHKAMGTQHFVDFDFDGTASRPSDVARYVNPEALAVVLTRGGFHALVTPRLVHPDFKKTWYKNISSLSGMDNCSDKMLPIPGTWQGGKMPRFLDPQSSTLGDTPVFVPHGAE